MLYFSFYFTVQRGTSLGVWLMNARLVSGKEGTFSTQQMVNTQRTGVGSNTEGTELSTKTTNTIAKQLGQACKL